MSTNPASRREARIALALSAGLLFGVVLLNGMFNDLRTFDFTTCYTGGSMVRQGAGAQLYDLREQARVQREIFKWEHLFMYLHPPFEALLFAPLTMLSFRRAYILWGGISVFLWVLFQHLVRPHAPVPAHPFRYLLLCALFFPLWAALMQGQTSVLVLVLFSLTFVCLKRSQDLRAGAFLGLALLKFHFALPFALMCLLRRKWKLMAGFAFSASLLGILSIAVVGPAGLASYASLLLDILRHPANPAYEAVKPWNMPTTLGFFTAVFRGGAGPMWIDTGAAAFSAYLIVFTAWRWRKEDPRQTGNSLGLMFAGGLVVSLIASPYLYTHDMVLILLAVVLGLRSFQGLERSHWHWVLAVSVVILYFPPVYLVLLRRQRLSLLWPVLLAFALATMALAVRQENPQKSRSQESGEQQKSEARSQKSEERNLFFSSPDS